MKGANILRRNPVAIFTILAFILPSPILALRYVDLPSEPVLVYASWTPNLAAFLVLGLILQEKGGIRKLVAGWGKWRAGIQWYLMAISPLAIPFIAAGMAELMGKTTAGPQHPIGLFLQISFVISLLTGALGEELGWRGFLLPRLQAKYNGLKASLIVGVIWSLWHLPLWALPGQGWDEIPYWTFALVTIASSVLYTFVVNNTGGSLLMASLVHFSMNYGMSMAGVLGVLPTPTETWSIVSGLYVLYAIIVVAIAGPDLSRLKSVGETSFT